MQINPNAKFYDDEDVDGVRLLTSLEQVNEIRKLLGRNIKGPDGLFAAMWPVDMAIDHLQKVLENPYFVAPRPHGHRFMLYIDTSGQIFMENNSRNVFQLEDECKIRFLSRDGRAITDTVIDGVLTRTKANPTNGGNIENDNKHKLTFVIIDAARYNGRDLTKLSVTDRMECVKVSR